jgi:hypothetical protein
LPILFALLICADLATAHGSFLVDGWKVWNNATISARSRVEAELVPVKITLPSKQTLWLGARSSVRFTGRRILVEKGCAQLDSAGTYMLDAKFVNGLLAGADDAGRRRASEIPREDETLRELRPMSQRP